MPMFCGRQLGPSFASREVTIPPGGARSYRESEWRDALVVVERGEVDLECREGGRRRFRCGAILWMTGLGLRMLHNPGSEPAVLVAIWRRGS